MRETQARLEQRLERMELQAAVSQARAPPPAPGCSRHAPRPPGAAAQACRRCRI